VHNYFVIFLAITSLFVVHQNPIDFSLCFKSEFAEERVTALGTCKSILLSCSTCCVLNLQFCCNHTDMFLMVSLIKFCMMQTGWMMWNWYVSALAVGSSIVCYDGSPLVPHINVLWDLVDQLKLEF
jgi:hypothetical protein